MMLSKKQKRPHWPRPIQEVVAAECLLISEPMAHDFAMHINGGALNRMKGKLQSSVR